MSLGEETLLLQLRALKLPAPEREYRFAPPRRWRFDFCYPGRMLAIEVEGGTWIGGRHGRGTGYANDLEKYNQAVVMGWRVLRYTTDQVVSGAAVAQIAEVLER